MEENFALTQEEYDKFKDVDIKTSLENLEKFDFSSDEKLNLDEYYEMIELLKVSQNQSGEKKEVVQFNEAQNVIDREGEKFLGKDVVDAYKKPVANF